MEIPKVEINPVTPTVLNHHRELPPGRYQHVLHGFRTSLRLLREMSSGKLYLIDWKGKADLRDDFEVTPEGELASYTFVRMENP